MEFNFNTLPVVNGLGKAREVTFQGRRYLVMPATTIIADGVLPGSKGRLYYPSQETMASVKDWDGIPVTFDHPNDPLTNDHCRHHILV